MSTFDAQSILKRLFSRLRKRGFRPGVGKYLAAIDAVEQGYTNNPEDLKLTLRLLWCQSRDELKFFEPIWDEVYAENLPEQQQTQRSRSDQLDSTESNLETEIAEESFSPTLEIAPIPQSEPKFDFVPVRAPRVEAIEGEGSGDLDQDFPISRRSMVYAWRHLRRLIPLGRQDVLDEQATVAAFAQQGFYLTPIYRRREVNRTHLVLLVDREGSMVPFHRFVRDLVETALDESGIERVEVFYFRNVFTDTVFCDEYLAEPLALRPIKTTKAALAESDRDTIVMIISDGGAAKGHDSFERFHACTEFLYTLRQEVDTIVWLNPLPKERWYNTSAEKIAYFVPMYSLDREELDLAIAQARGQTTTGRGKR